jgi:putative DNA methylase
VALTTFSDLVQEAIEKCRQDALAAGLADDGTGLDAGGSGARRMRRRWGFILGFAVDRLQMTGQQPGAAGVEFD